MITRFRLAGAACAVLAALGAALALVPGAIFEPEAKAAAPARTAAVLVSKPAVQPADPLPPPVSQVLQTGVLIVVSKASQRMYVFKDGAPWASSPVSTGKRGKATPAGVFPILQKKTFHRSNIYSNAPMPYMQRLTWSGIAIHAGYLPGYPASHGCIRLPKAFARSLFNLTRVSATTVVVTNSAVRSNGSAITLALNMPVPGTKAVPQAPAPALALASPRIEPLPLDPIQAPAMRRGQTIQLAAAGSAAEADAQWAQLISVHPELAGFEKAVIPAVVGNRRVYRLRATAPGAHAYCASLKTAGQACFNVS